MNYDFPSKRHWRRSLWNCIADRVAVPRRDALVLYLAGASDEDRPVALSKGFSGHNLIAVEREQDAADRLRSAGVLTLVGDAFQHLMAWRHDRAVDVVVLDLCCGLTEAVQDRILELQVHPAFARAVFAVNLLRGRDKAGEAARHWARDGIDRVAAHRLTDKEAREISSAYRQGLVSLDDLQRAYDREVPQQLGVCGTKHRGEHIRYGLMVLWAHMASVMLARGAQFDVQVEASAVFTAARFQTLTYRSTAHQTFDTLVWRNPLQASALNGREWADALDAGESAGPARRQQAAVFAHRTRRLAA